MSYFSIPRSTLIGETLLDGNTNDSNDGTKVAYTLTNGSYTNTSVWYQKQCAVFWATTSFTRASLAGIQTLAIAVYPTAASKTLFTYVTTTGLVTFDGSYVVSTSGLSNVTIYVNGVASSTLVANKWNLLIITHDAATATNFNLGSSSFLGNACMLRTYSSKLTEIEREQLIHEFNRTLAGWSDPLQWIVSYYDFNGDANDVTGQNNGTVTGATLTTDKFGFANSAYDFNGTTNIISAAGVAITTAYTVFWRVKIDTVGTGAAERYIFRLHNSGTSILHFMTYQDKWYVYHSGGAKVIQPSSPVPATSTYYNFQITYDGSTVTLYIDGVSIGTATSATTLGANNTLDIGGRAGLGFFDGIIDQIGFINTTRTADEVKALNALMNLRYLYQFKQNIISGFRKDTSCKFIIQNDVDVTGNGFNPTLTGSPVKQRVNQINSKYYTAGSTQYGMIDDASNMLSGLSSFTAGCWVKITGTGSMMIFNAWEWGPWLIKNNGSNVLETLVYTNWSWAVTNTTTVSLTDWKWHHVAVSYWWNLQTTYIDWHIEKTVSQIWTLQYSRTPGKIMIGSNRVTIPTNPSYTERLTGHTDGHFLFTRKLSINEIRALAIWTFRF